MCFSYSTGAERNLLFWTFLGGQSDTEGMVLIFLISFPFLLHAIPNLIPTLSTSQPTRSGYEVLISLVSLSTCFYLVSRVGYEITRRSLYR